MKKFNTILAVTAVALTSVFGLASCEQDDDFDYMPTNTTTLAQDTVRGTRGEIRGPQDPTDPFRGGITYHFGDKVTKNIYKYGDAEFVCISNYAPYYFIHVSDKKYTKGEKDNVSYAQSEYAATTDKLLEVAKVIQPEFIDWIHTYDRMWSDHNFDGGGYIYNWKTDAIIDAVKSLRTFIPVVMPDFNIAESESQFDVTSEEFWISNSHDYPYAYIKWYTSGNIPKGGLKNYSPYNYVEVEDTYHLSYATPCDGHRLFYIAKTND